MQPDPEVLSQCGVTLNPEDLMPASEEEKEGYIQKPESMGYWADAKRRFKENKVAMVSLYFILIVIVFAFIGPLFVKGDYTTQFRGMENLGPSMRFPFGTDKLGRDLMVRTMFGARVSIIVGVFASLIVLVIGTIYGSVSGYLGGKVDNVMMRILDLVYSVPDVLVVILLAITINNPLKSWVNASQSSLSKSLQTLGPGLISIFIAFGLLYWVSMARIIRGQVLTLKQNEYITAVVALGGSKKRIIKKHLYPNCIGQIIVMTAMQIPSAIFLESFLSFLGIGVSAPMTSLGAMASDGLGGIYSYPHRLVIPSVVLSLIILSLNLIGDGLRDALDPRLKK
ncbi:MAG: ABC transporter permease [Tissierellia bacterium]|nr:ABC transporter permease [Tissierellia bacterium]